MGGFKTGTDVKMDRKRCVKISTGSKQLDAALNGSDAFTIVFGAVTNNFLVDLRQ